jgi:hypothetical protein
LTSSVAMFFVRCSIGKEKTSQLAAKKRQGTDLFPYPVVP